MPESFFIEGRTYIFFAHVIKGQKYNMPMLKKMMELNCNLIDYERMLDKKGRRLIAFGRYAGIAGMIDTLWAFGQRLAFDGVRTPFFDIKKTHKYKSLEQAKKDISEVGERIKKEGVQCPLIIGITGYGNVSGGAQEIIDILPVEEISPLDVYRVQAQGLYKVVFREEDMVELKAKSKKQKAKIEFDLQDYYNHPERYRSKFYNYLPYLSILMNCIYWEEKYPRFVTKDDIKRLYKDGSAKLKVIGDISCDIEGAIEITLHTTESDMPVYTYDPYRDTATLGFEGNGVLIMAVDNLPCELPIESSVDFSRVLKRFIPAIVNADYNLCFDRIDLPPELKKALILHKGRLTEDYKYLEEFVS